jgi:predicted DNA-binding transcriptional regulator AlpA
MSDDSPEFRALPAVVDLVTAARLLGIGRTVAYQLVRQGTWPTPVLRLGHQIKVPSAPLLELLGLSPDVSAGLLEPPPAGHPGSSARG